MEGIASATNFAEVVSPLSRNMGALRFFSYIHDKGLGRHSLSITYGTAHLTI